MIDPDLIRRARQADLAAYLLNRNEPLVKSGRRYRHREHDSLVFTANTYYFNSRQEHGNSVDYLMRHMNMSFENAVQELIDQTPHAAESDPRTPLKDYSGAETAPEITDIKQNSDCKRAIAYLTKTRHIDYSVIQGLLKSKHLFQEAETGNIIFPIYDEHNAYVGAEVQGTLSDVRFKGVKPNSRYGYGFNVRFPVSANKHLFTYVLFFESAVDMLSFIDIKTCLENKTLEHCILVSLAGLKLPTLKHTLQSFSSPKVTLKCVLCVDNDNAANIFRETVTKECIEYYDLHPPHEFKDWNEYLNSINNQY